MIEELLEVVLSAQSIQRLCNEKQWNELGSLESAVGEYSSRAVSEQ